MTIRDLTRWYQGKEYYKVLIYCPSEGKEYFKGVVADIPEDIAYLAVLSHSPRQYPEDTLVIYI